ncbi:MAG: MarR family winged helix-turn-helix transcriptional regulator [Acidimicrobiia bacterium]
MTDPMLTSAGYLLLKAGTQFHTVVDDTLAELDLNGRQLLVLTFTGAEEHLSQQMLSVRLGLDPTIIVALVDELEDRGLVVRERDLEDRRRHRLRLTPAGRTVRAAAVRAVTQAEKEFLAPLDRTERDTLRRLLVATMTPRLPWMTPD